jgi:hypothetical protein
VETTRWKGSILRSPKGRKSSTSRSVTPGGARGREKSLKNGKSVKTRSKSNKSRLSKLSGRSSVSAVSAKQRSTKKKSKALSRSVNQLQNEEYNKFSKNCRNDIQII